MSTKLSLQTRLDELESMAQGIKKDVDVNKKKIRDAQTAAAAGQTTAAAMQTAASAAIAKDNTTLTKK